MSWDIYIMNFPPAVKTIDDVPEDFEGAPLGQRDALIAQIREIIPNVDFSTPDWGNFDGDGSSIEFNMGIEPICTSIMLHVRGGGNPTPLIAALLDRLNLRAIDCQTGEFFDVEEAKTSFGSWQKYRDKVAQPKTDR